jgi:hypothetical protein
MVVLAVIGATVPIIGGAAGVVFHAWIVVGIAVAIFLIYMVWAPRRVHHFACVACGHDADDHHRLGEKAEVRDCIPRRREDRPLTA